MRKHIKRWIAALLCLAMIMGVPAYTEEMLAEIQIEQPSAESGFCTPEPETEQENADLQEQEMQILEIEMPGLEASGEDAAPVEIAAEDIAPAEPEEIILAFRKSQITIGVGDTFDINRLLDISGGSEDEALTYASSKKKYVSCSAGGVVKGVKKGSANITVTAANGASATIKVKVCTLATAKKISFNPKSLTMAVHSGREIAVKFSSGYYGLYQLHSSDENIIRVDENGVVYAVGTGSAEVVLSLLQKSSVQKKLKVTVKDIPETIEASRASLTLCAGQSSTAVFGVNPDEENTYCGFTYSSSDESVVIADAATGELTAVGMGRATITIAADNNPAAIAYCEITVIELAQKTLYLGIGDTCDLAKIIRQPDDDGEYSYSSSSKKYVSVNADGVVKGVKAGSANITIKNADGLSVKLKVVARKYATSGKMSITPANSVLGEGMYGKLTVKFSSGYHGLYELTSSDEGVIRVDEAGNVYAAGTGEAIVVATLIKKPEISKVAAFTVLPAPEEITASQSALVLGEGQVSTALYGVNPTDGETMCSFVYESSDESVVTADAATGELTAVSSGEAEIIISAGNNPAAQARCRITVLNAPQSIAFSEKTITIGKGDTFDIKELIELSENSAAAFKFSSSSKKYAAVSADGIVKGVAKGSATITVKTHNGLSAKLKVSVKTLASAGKMKISPAEITIGEQMESGIAVKFSSGYYGLHTFESADTRIVQVDAQGRLMAMAPGETQIIVRLVKKPEVYKTASVKVLPAPETISVSVGELTLAQGQVSSALYGINPDEEASRCNFVYRSENETVARVDPATGALTALEKGETRIFVYAHNNPDACAVCNVSVVDAPESIIIENQRTRIGVKESCALEYSFYPENAAAELTFASSAGSVLSVNREGVMTGKKAGKATVTITAHNGVQAQLEIQVCAAPGSIRLLADRNVLGMGESLQLTAELPSGSAGAYHFESSDEAVLSIDPQSGFARAVGVGTAAVKAVAFNGKADSMQIDVLNAPEYMVVDPVEAVIGAGDILKLAASPNEHAAGAYTFSSENAGIAIVDAEGYVTAVSPGETGIVACAYNGAQGAMKLRVIEEPATIGFGNLEKDANGNYALRLYRGDAFQLEIEAGDYTSLTMEYFSTDNDVAVVSETGLISVKGTGTAQIIAMAYSGASAAVNLTVEKWTDTYSPRAFAHALGGIGGKSYSNSLEAFHASYEKGYRIFEADFSYTVDGQLVLWHDWDKDKINSKTPLGYVPFADEFAEMKIYDKYTSLSYRDLLNLMVQYPDVYLITDTKYEDAGTVAIQFSEMVDIAHEMGCGDVLDRLIVQIYNKKMLSVVEEVYSFDHYIFTLYNLYSKAPSTAQFEDVASFCNANGIDLITMPKSWWSTRYTGLMGRYDVDVALHTVNNASEAKKYFTQGVTAVYTDFLSAEGT